jgi:hypothetical protein
MQRSRSSIELIILDLRYFIDESLTFLEVYEASRSSRGGDRRPFTTSNKELAGIRHYAIEFNRLVFDLKRLLNTDESIADKNPAVEFTSEFENKRTLFFRKIFERIDLLYKQMYRNRAHIKSNKKNDLTKLYFRIILRMAQTSNLFIGRMQSMGWERANVIAMLDSLVPSCNDFLCVFETFCVYLEQQSDQEAAQEMQTNEEATDSELVTENSSRASHLRESVSKFGNYFSNVAERRNVRSCPCIFIILFTVILILLVVLILPIVRLFLSASSTQSELSSVYTFNLDESSSLKPLSNMSNEQRKLLQIVKLPASLYTQLTATKTTDVARTRESTGSDEFDWTSVFEYMSDFYIVLASFATFLSFEWLISK